MYRKITYLVTLLVILFVHKQSRAQSLGIERVNILKAATVKILVDGKPSGTGFFASPDGHIITCFHVIEPGLQKRMKIEIELSTGERIEAGLFNYLLNEGLRESIGYDFTVILPMTKPKTGFTPLKIGPFDSISEGDEILTIGFPLGISQPVITRGTLSTKWSQQTNFTFASKPDSMSRIVAWLDLTMNKGNSGGAIIKLGPTPADDVVIGIATFILNPFANAAQQLSYSYSNARADIAVGGISNNKVGQLFADAIGNNSIGVSGCISIDHLLSVWKKLPK